MKTRLPCSANRQRGAGLIEVLVALLIASLGLMSMARLNVYGFDLGGYDIALNEAVPNAPAVDANANDVTAATNVAQADKLEFMQRVANHLPQGLAVVNSTRAPGARDLDVWILWQDVNTEPSGALLAAGESQCPAGVNGNSCLYIKVRL